DLGLAIDRSRLPLPLLTHFGHPTCRCECKVSERLSDRRRRPCGSQTGGGEYGLGFSRHMLTSFQKRNLTHSLLMEFRSTPRAFPLVATSRAERWTGPLPRTPCAPLLIHLQWMMPPRCLLWPHCMQLFLASPAAVMCEARPMMQRSSPVWKLAHEVSR